MMVLRGLTLLCLLASAMVHAFGAWPSMQQQLMSNAVNPKLIAGLQAGWWFGSLWMLAVAALLIRHMRASDQTFGLRLAAVVYLLFGIGGFLLRNFHPHYLGFVVCGVLLWVCARPSIQK